MDVTRYVPGFSVDCVIFGYHEGTLRVLLLDLPQLGKWALPGGFVERGEDVDAAAIRVLQERTGLGQIFLQQFHLFGQASRYDPAHPTLLRELGLLDEAQYAFFQQRFLSLGYYALVEYSRVATPRPDSFSARCAWQPLRELPSLMIDHQEIIDRAYAQLRRDLRHQPIGKNLLPARFTMSELRGLYETLLDQTLDRRNFQRKMLGYGILRKTAERRQGGAHKSPFLYEFDEASYQQALTEGLETAW